MLPVPFLAVMDKTGFLINTWRLTMSKITNNRNKAFRNQAGRCIYCNAPMWQDDPDRFASAHGLSRADAKRFQCTAEHRKPRCDGGSDEIGNIAAACRYCNQGRHRRNAQLSPDEFLAFVRKRLKKGKWHPARHHAHLSMDMR